MYKYRLKSLLIVALAALAIYQISQLWFVHITNRSLAMYFTAFFNPSVPDGYEELVRPMRVVFGNGTGQFDMRYGIPAPEAEDAFAQVLRHGVFDGTRNTADALETALQGPVIIYEYAFPLRADVFEKAFGRRNTTLLTDHGVEAFDRVAIIPDSVIFFNNEQASRFHLPGNGIELPEFIINNNLYFISEGGQFVPRTRIGWRHRPILRVNPYTNRMGAVRPDSVNAQVGHFFDNPATRNPRMVENVITISALDTVIRFFHFPHGGDVHILDYNCFRPIRRGGAPDFVADFSAALAFVQRDPNVVNSFYLAGYEARGRTHVFWFNYIVECDGGGFPLLVPEGGWGSAYDPLPFPIEVVADHGHVTRYRKLAYNFIPDTARQHIIRDMSPIGEGGRVILGFPAESGATLEVRG